MDAYTHGDSAGEIDKQPDVLREDASTVDVPVVNDQDLSRRGCKCVRNQCV
jgi:hypothetical protein